MHGWNTKITEIYSNKEPVNPININDITQNIAILKNKLNNIITKAIEKNNLLQQKESYVGLFGPFYNQGLGIQLQEYYYFLSSK